MRTLTNSCGEPNFPVTSLFYKSSKREIIDGLHALGQCAEHTLQVTGDLFASGPISIAQLTPHVLARLGQERKDG